MFLSRCIKKHYYSLQQALDAPLYIRAARFATPHPYHYLASQYSYLGHNAFCSNYPNDSANQRFNRSAQHLCPTRLLRTQLLQEPPGSHYIDGAINIMELLRSELTADDLKGFENLYERLVHAFLHIITSSAHRPSTPCPQHIQ